mgnify:CR=1 FL=1
MTKNPNNLTKLRTQIDSLDRELLSILAQRRQVSMAIGRYKHKHKLPALDPKRWEVVMTSRLIHGQSLGLSETFIKKLFTLIHHQSLLLQKD